jgi:quinol monooxygenase YgiN
MIVSSMAELLTVVAEMQAKPGKEEELRRAVLSIVEPTRKEDGCVQYDLHVHTSDPGRFVFYENWTSPSHLDRHAVSSHIQAFRAAIADLVAAPPQIETYTRIA